MSTDKTYRKTIATNIFEFAQRDDATTLVPEFDTTQPLEPTNIEMLQRATQYRDFETGDIAFWSMPSDNPRNPSLTIIEALPEDQRFVVGQFIEIEGAPWIIDQVFPENHDFTALSTTWAHNTGDAEVLTEITDEYNEKLAVIRKTFPMADHLIVLTLVQHVGSIAELDGQEKIHKIDAEIRWRIESRLREVFVLPTRTTRSIAAQYDDTDDLLRALDQIAIDFTRPNVDQVPMPALIDRLREVLTATALLQERATRPDELK